MMRAMLIPPMVLACAACVPTSPAVQPAAGAALRVSNNGQAYQMWEGAAARKAADATCGPRGVRSSIYDRYDRVTGEWVYPGGCA
jgi:hypothetical protein